MSLRAPRGEAEIVAWRETVTETLNDLPEHASGRTVTTDATPTVILSLPIPSGAVFGFDWEVLARQTAGGSGTVGDGLVYEGKIGFHLVSSTATVIGSGTTQITAKDDSGWSVGVAGSNQYAQWTVTGAANKTITWRINVNSRRVFV